LAGGDGSVGLLHLPDRGSGRDLLVNPVLIASGVGFVILGVVQVAWGRRNRIGSLGGFFVIFGLILVFLGLTTPAK
jgi:multisubunit Na+/H+ antiporter MnhG subunit